MRKLLAQVLALLLMAVPAFQTIGQLSGNNFTTAQIPVPASVASGDVIVVVFHFESDATVSPPSGFTLKYNSEQNDGAGAFHQYTYWKRATGADSGTYDFTWDGTSVWCEGVAMRFNSVISTGDPFVANSAFQIPSGSGTAFENLGMYAPTETMAIWAGDGFNTTNITPPSSLGRITWTERSDQSNMGVATAPNTAGGGIIAFGQALSIAGSRTQRLMAIIGTASAEVTTPTIVGVGPFVEASSGTALNLTYPNVGGGILANDIGIAFLGGKNNLAFTMPGSWASLYALNNGTTHRAEGAWLRLSGGESGNVNFAIGSSSTLVRGGFIYVIRNALASGDPNDGAWVTNADASADAVVDWSDYDPGVADDLILWHAHYADDFTTTGALSAGTPTGDAIFEAETTTGTDMSLKLYAGTHAGSHAAVGARTSTWTVGANGVHVGAVGGIEKAVAAAEFPPQLLRRFQPEVVY